MSNTIREEFLEKLKIAGKKYGFVVNSWKGTPRRSKNIIEISGSINCVIYLKVRSEQPYRWGVTKNRINELNSSNRNWVLVLLYESPDTGYILDSDQVNRSLKKWPLGSDGDYKVALGKYLIDSTSFYSFENFIQYLQEKCRWENMRATADNSGHTASLRYAQIDLLCSPSSYVRKMLSEIAGDGVKEVRKRV